MTGLPEIRRLHDAAWSSDELRTEHMARLTEALKPWASWDEAQRRAYTERVVIWTVRNLIADLPGLSGALREKCRSATTLAEAAAAAEVAASAVEATAAEWAAWAAARAAEWAAARAAEVAAWAVEATASAAEVAAWAVEVAWAAAAARAADASADRDATLIRAVNGWIACVDGAS